MHEFLIASSDGDWNLAFSQWDEAFRPHSLTYTRLPGVEYRIEVCGVPIYFADEMPGIQIRVEGDLPEKVIRQIADEVLENLVSLTGQNGRVIDLG